MAENVRLLANKSSRFTPERAFGTTFETIPFREWPHELKRCFMITKQAFIEDDLAEIEKILEEEWDNRRRSLQKYFQWACDKATV